MLLALQVHVHMAPLERGVCGCQGGHGQGCHRMHGTRNAFQPESQKFYFLAELLFPFPLASSEINSLTWVTFLSFCFFPATSFAFPDLRCILDSYSGHPVKC